MHRLIWHSVSDYQWVEIEHKILTQSLYTDTRPTGPSNIPYYRLIDLQFEIELEYWTMATIKDSSNQLMFAEIILNGQIKIDPTMLHSQFNYNYHCLLVIAVFMSHYTATLHLKDR